MLFKKTFSLLATITVISTLTLTSAYHTGPARASSACSTTDEVPCTPAEGGERAVFMVGAASTTISVSGSNILAKHDGQWKKNYDYYPFDVPGDVHFFLVVDGNQVMEVGQDVSGPCVTSPAFIHIDWTYDFTPLNLSRGTHTIRFWSQSDPNVNNLIDGGHFDISGTFVIS